MKKSNKKSAASLIAPPNGPMTNWSRVIIETDEKHPKIIACVTNTDYRLADGFRVRLKP